MKRKEFLQSCGSACLGTLAFSSVLEGCKEFRYVECSITESDLIVPISCFVKKDNSFGTHVVAYNDKLKFPVCVFRLSSVEYSAVWMECTHQGTELQVFGDRLQCPAHGSEFTSRGIVQNGPADTNLRAFPVILVADQLHISLK